jgi:hypothetical protein
MAIAGTLFPVWVALAALTLLVAMVIWSNQRELVFQASEVRASQAEARAATAEAVVTTQASTQAATATAFAYSTSPEAVVDRGLSLVLSAGRDPTEARLRAVNDVFAPAALNILRPELEHLLSGGLHLGGESGYELFVLTTDHPAAEQAQVRTRERWTYDERSESDKRARCVVETSEQIYTLRRAAPDWRVVEIEILSASRADCPT